MTKQLDGDRKQPNQDRRSGSVSHLVAFGIVLAAIALAIWHHNG